MAHLRGQNVRDLQEALQKAGLNASVRELKEWMSSGATSVSCVGVVWGDASMDTSHVLKYRHEVNEVLFRVLCLWRTFELG